MINSFKKIILFHPPSFYSHTMQLDGYCSQKQKGAFRWHPVDFVAIQSFYRQEIQVEIIDCGEDKEIKNEIYDKLKDENNLIIGLIGIHGFSQSVQFYDDLLTYNENLILTGDIARSDPEFIFKSINKLKFIIPELSQPPHLSDIININNTNKLWQRSYLDFILPKSKKFSIGIQDSSLWDKNKYSIPFLLKKPFASIITQVGCPYNCSYCILSSYDLSIRDYTELDEELQLLKSKGVKHLYIRDATFNSSKDHVIKVVNLLKKYSFNWNAFFDLRNLDSIISLLENSNLKVAMIGFDFVRREEAKSYHKFFNIDEKEMVVKLKKIKVKVAGHYVLFGKGKTSQKEIIARANYLNLDWLTYSPLEIRPGVKEWNVKLLNDFSCSAEVSTKKELLKFYLNPFRFFRNIVYYFFNYKKYFASLFL